MATSHVVYRNEFCLTTESKVTVFTNKTSQMFILFFFFNALLTIVINSNCANIDRSEGNRSKLEERCTIEVTKYELLIPEKLDNNGQLLSFSLSSFYKSNSMDLEEIGINAGNWVDSAQDKDYWRALVNAALNLRVP